MTICIPLLQNTFRKKIKNLLSPLTWIKATDSAQQQILWTGYSFLGKNDKIIMSNRSEKLMLKKIDHIGIAVHSIDRTRIFYEQALGLHCERIEEVASQKVRTAFFSLGEAHIELVEPMDADSPIAKYLENRGEGIHHIAYQTDDLAAQLDKARSAGCKLINEQPATGAHGKRIVFLHPKSTHGVLTEICESKTS